MPGWRDATNKLLDRPLVAPAAALAVLAGALVLVEPALGLLVAVPGLGLWVAHQRAGRGSQGLQVDQLERLHDAELAVASASSPQAAAQELAEHAIALLGAPSAVVLIEGIGDTVRVTAGTGSVYGDGSRMRLLDDNGTPAGSIAVSARADGKPYSERDERILDALAQRVSSTLHRLSLFDEVQRERRTIADVLSSSSDGIFSVSVSGEVRSWNPAMARITGILEPDAVGQPSHTVFRPEDEEGRPRFGSSDPGWTGEPHTSLVRISGADAEERWLTCSWSPLSEGGYMVVARDDTERKKIQDDKDGWIAQVSHELRTPLTPIKGFLHTLQRRDAEFSHDDRTRIYDVMLREEQRLEDLVTSLLQATSLDRAGTVVPAVVDWGSVVTHQVDLFLRQDPTRTVDLTVAPDAGTVVADEHLASGVLSNLLSNALKYSPEGSAIAVRAERDGDMVITSVSDGGPGVPSGDRERIFEKFTRLGDHLTRPQQGVGLGLYIARKSVERLGGTIWVDTADGGGAAFAFSLPALEQAPEVPTDDAARAGGGEIGDAAAGAGAAAGGSARTERRPLRA
jgi:PAS domain S-box-containing protein